ncbi:MAG TPA: galactose oxidase-like domain-containing protein [Pyrinomonadaceae bacterium]
MMHKSLSVSAKTARRLLLLLCSLIIALATIAPVTEGAKTAAPPVRPQSGDPSIVGQWAAPLWLGFIPIHVSVLPNGKALMWGRDLTYDYFGNEIDVTGSTQTYLFDPAQNGFVAYPYNSTTNMFCSGHIFLPDGRLLVTGGHKGDDGLGEPHSNFFDYTTNTFSFGPLMNAGRWYPTACALGNGEALVTSGTNEFGQLNTLPQVLQTNQTWRPLTGADQGQPLYPMLLLAPNSKVFMAGPNAMARYLSTAGTGSWTDVASTNAGTRDYGTAVMYDDGKVLLAGGGAPTNSAQVINLSGNFVDPADKLTVKWMPTNPMAFPRKQLNATLLPDGNVLVTGGTSIGFTSPSGAVYAAEMWSPDTGQWSTLASAARPRLYHSTAVLLPDGRVLTGGGGGLHPPDHSIDEMSLEIYSPPYLFKGARPSITSAPAVASHGQQIFVGTPDATSISKVTLVRLSSVTHAFNENQRINTLSFRQATGGLNVTLPGSGNLCPPGHYMMFIVNSNGVPSVASIIQLTIPGSPSNAIDDQRYFVRQLYYDFFARDPDAGGWRNWTNYITQCGNDAACLQDHRIISARGFIDSSEFRRNNPALQQPGTLAYNQEFVRQCYLVFLRRQPDSSGYNAWLNYLNNTNDEYTVIHGFIYSGEYRNRFYKP